MARQAVATTSATDFLDLAAGAWLDLAAVLQAAGSSETAAAASEAHRLFSRKGNLVGAGRALALMEVTPTMEPGS
jgi:hypothetical protein